MPLFCIKDPKGKLLLDTFPDSLAHWAWEALGNDTRFNKKWDKFDPSFKYDHKTVAKKLGYRCVRVYLTEEKP